MKTLVPLAGQPDPRFADVIALGRMQSLHSQSLLKHYFWLGVAGLALVCSLASSSQNGASLGIVILPAFVAVCGILVLIAIHRQRAAAIFDSGFAYYDGKRLLQFGWDAVTRLVVNIVSDGEGGGSVSYSIVAQRQLVDIPSSLQQFQELWRLICLQSALAAIHRGGALTYEPLLVDAHGLRFERDGKEVYVDWREVRALSARNTFWRPTVEFGTAGGPVSLHVGRGPGGDFFPDLGSFERLCRELIREASAAPASVAWEHPA